MFLSLSFQHYALCESFAFSAYCSIQVGKKNACLTCRAYVSLAVGEVDNALCFYGVGGLHSLLVLHPGKWGILWYDVEFEKFVCADTIGSRRLGYRVNQAEPRLAILLCA